MVNPWDGPAMQDVDLLAEVYVGRAATANETEVSNFVRKTLAYEKAESDYLRNVYMLGEHLGFSGVSEYAKPYMEEIRQGTDAHGYTTVGFENSDYAGYFDTSWLYDQDSEWPNTEVKEIIDGGVNILNHLEHADPTYNMKLYTSDLPLLKNNEYCFIYSQGCLSGRFDDTDDCFAEVITTMENGAFAVVMNSRVGWCLSSGINSTAGPSQFYNREFWDAFFNEKIRNLGRMNQDSKEDNIGRISLPNMRWCYYELNLFGDPETSINTDINAAFSITTPERDAFVHDVLTIEGTASAQTGFQQYELYYAAMDSPEDTIPITSSNSPVNEGILGVWNTAACADGDYILSLKITCSNGDEWTYPITLTVDNINEPPVFKVPVRKTAVIGRLLEFKVVVEDPDDPELSRGQIELTVENFLPGADFDPQTQIFSWHPQETDKGIYEITFSVNDMANREHVVSQKVILDTLFIRKTDISPESHYSHKMPSIYKDKLVWSEYVHSDKSSHIFMYDIATREKSQITSVAGKCTSQSIYEDTIVWGTEHVFVDDGKFMCTYGIYMSNILTEELLPIVEDEHYRGSVDIFEGRVVWSDRRGGNSDIYMYDIETKEAERITDHEANQDEPVIFGDRIVWTDRRNTSYSDIYMYNTFTEELRQMTFSQTAYNPIIHGDRMIWIDTRLDTRDRESSALYMYDFQQEKESKLDIPVSEGLDIYETKVVFEYFELHDENIDIYLRDLVTKDTINITAQPGYQTCPAIYGNRVAYLSYSPDNPQDRLQLAELFFVPEVEDITPRQVYPGELVTISGRNFGQRQEESNVTLDGNEITSIEYWSPTAITFKLPEDALSGSVYVTTLGGTGNGGDIIVRSVLYGDVDANVDITKEDLDILLDYVCGKAARENINIKNAAVMYPEQIFISLADAEVLNTYLT